MAKTVSRLQRELKKRRAFESAAQEAWLNMIRTTSQLQIQFDRLFAQHGLTSPQYNVLRILRGEGKPLPILEIANRLIAMVPGITGLIDRLENVGLVQRERSAEDRRVIFVSITDKALATLKMIDRPLEALTDEIMQPLSVAEQRELTRLMERLRSPSETF